MALSVPRQSSREKRRIRCEGMKKTSIESIANEGGYQIEEWVACNGGLVVE